MLLNFPAKSMSRVDSAIRFTGSVQRCDPSAPAKNEVENPGMFMIRMPSSAKPRTMSSVGIRSFAVVGPLIADREEKPFEDMGTRGSGCDGGNATVRNSAVKTGAGVARVGVKTTRI